MLGPGPSLNASLVQGGGPKKHESVEAKQRNMLWMEEILHHLVDGLSNYNPIPIVYSVSWLPNGYQLVRDFATIHRIIYNYISSIK